MNAPLNFGIIGYGGFGKFIFQALQANDSINVIAIADEALGGEEVPEEIRFEKRWEKVLSIDNLDAVIVSTPPSTHFEIAQKSVLAGKNVLVEKPMTLTRSQAQALNDMAREHDKVVMVDFLQRFNPLLEALHDLHQAHLFGALERYYVENYAQDESLPPEHWFWDPSVSGGILLEHAVHFMDLVHWFSDSDIRTIQGYGDQRNAAQTDRVFASVQYEDGLIASHYHSFTRPQIFERTKMRFVFETAQFDLNGWIPESGAFTLLGDDALIKKLQTLPNLEIQHSENVRSTKVRGLERSYDTLYEGTFASSDSKEKLYKQAINKLIQDFCTKLNDPQHRSRVTMEDSIKAIHLAETATNVLSVTKK